MGNCYPNVANPTPSNMEMSTELTQLPCTLCNRTFPPRQFRNHLDKEHFMVLKDDPNGICCQCLFCGELCPSIQRHFDHANNVHFRFDDPLDCLPVSTQTLNSDLKASIQQIPFQLLGNLRYVGHLNRKQIYEGDYLGNRYQIVATKQQDVLQLEDKYVRSNLIWKEILLRFPHTQYYAVAMIDGKQHGFLLIESQQ